MGCHRSVAATDQRRRKCFYRGQFTSAHHLSVTIDQPTLTAMDPLVQCRGLVGTIAIGVESYGAKAEKVASSPI